MMINKHGSFYIRNGWPTKILLAVRNDNHIFSPNFELQAVDSIGMGRVMIKALRYWSDAMGLTIEDKDVQGIFCTETALFREIFEYDLFLQDIGSLWLLHRGLATNEEKATAWYWAFNCFDKAQFTKLDFVDALYGYMVSNGATNRKPAVEKEFDCFKNTYVCGEQFDVKKIIEEDTIPFFAPLGLISLRDGNVFEKQKTKARAIPLDILLYCILKDNQEHLINNHQISIDSLLEQKNQVGKYFSLNYSTLIEMLQLLENRGKIHLINNFGNRHIEVDYQDTDELLRNYFQSIGR